MAQHNACYSQLDNSNNQLYCGYHNLNHCDWVMCPLCFDTLCTIIRAHCTTQQFNQILAILLGDGCQHSHDQAVSSDTQSLEDAQTECTSATSCEEHSPDSILTGWDLESQTAEAPASQEQSSVVGLVTHALTNNYAATNKEELMPHEPSSQDLENVVKLGRTYALQAHNLHKLQLERQKHVDEDIHNFVNNLVDWYDYISDN